MLKTFASKDEPGRSGARGGRLAHAVAALSRACARRRWRTVLVTLALATVLGPMGVALGAGFTDNFSVPGADSQNAADLLARQFPQQAGDTTTVVLTGGPTSLAPGGAQAGQLAVAVDNLSKVPDVRAVVPAQISPDGRIALVTVQHSRPAQDLPDDTYQKIQEATRPAANAGLEVSFRGNLVNLQGDQPTPVGEVIGIIAAVVILTLLFRSVAAMLVSLAAALISIVIATLVLTVVSAFVAIPSVAPTLVVMLGLGAGIDYALFMVARFRERLRHGDDVVTAAGHAAGGTGVAVLAAGAIVMTSISALFVTGIPLIARMGMAAGLAVAISALGAVTVVPALLSIAGRRVLPKTERSGQPSTTTDGRRARALAGLVTRRPVRWASAVTVILLSLAAPALSMRLGNPDDGTRPAGDTRRVAYDRLAEGFGAGFNGPLLLAVRLNPTDAANQRTLRAIQDAVAADRDVATVVAPQVNPAGDTAVITVVPRSKPQDQATSELVDRLRTSTVPAVVTGVRVHVGGVTATFDDLAQTVADRLPLLITVVVALSMLLLTVLFRSIWLPLVSAVFNLLSIAAAYGVVTLAFQTDAGTRLLGVTPQPIISFVPMLMFAILFGLSMDYNVFLLSRVREEWLAGGDARRAVDVGIGRTAGVIGAAGAIMTLVFTGFVLEDQSEIKMIGLGLAVAVLVDVTLVRLVLSPAVLELLGPRAWWFPRVLRRLPNLDLDH